MGGTVHMGGGVLGLVILGKRDEEAFLPLKWDVYDYCICSV